MPQQTGTRSPSRWFRQLLQHREGDDVRLYCFPHAGGAASAYRSLARELSPGVDVRAVQYPGRQERRREEPMTSVTGLAGLIAAEMEEEPSPQPFAFFGHSMGAAVAYETARLLEGSGRPGPVRLFLSGRAAPSPQPRPGDRLNGDAALIAEIRRLGGTGSQFLEEPELLAMVLPALRADYRALASYSWVPGPPLSCPFTVLVGDSDPVVPATDAEAWAEFSASATTTLRFPGGHFYLDAGTAEVAAVVRDALGVRAALRTSRPPGR